MKEQLINTLLVVGNALLALVGAYAVYYINIATQKVKVQTQKIKDEQQKALVNSALDRIQDLTKKSVIATQETTAKALKQLVVDGKANREELVKLSEQVANDIVAQMSPNVKALAETEIADIKAYVLNLIENEVKNLKVE